MKVGIVILSRLSSKRLNKKALKKIGEKTILDRVIERVKILENRFKIILATSINDEDKILLKIAKQNNIYGFAHSLEDVLLRTFSCAKKFSLSHVVRISGDSPLIDPNLILHLFQSISYEIDIVTNVFPRSLPKGFSCEIIKIETLKRILDFTNDLKYREHVTNYIYDNPDKFKICNISNEKKIDIDKNFSIDTESDYQFINKLYQKQGEKLFGLNVNDILNLKIK